MRTCTWCGGAADTQDHLHPRCLGGGDGDNLTDACTRCNQDRGRITAAYGQIRYIERRLPSFRELSNRCQKGVRRAISTLRKSLPELLSLQQSWCDREIAAFGRAYSNAVTLYIPRILH